MTCISDIYAPVMAPGGIHVHVPVPQSPHVHVHVHTSLQLEDFVRFLILFSNTNNNA